VSTNAIADGSMARASQGSRAVKPIVSAIIPCFEEEDAIAAVVAAVLAEGVSEVVVADGGSRDRTVERATAAGARVVVERQRGYGRAVQAGITASRADANILLFLDGDGSDRTEFIPALISPIAEGRVVFVHGSRLRGNREPGSFSLQQIAAGRLAGLLLRLVYGVRFTDMSPFRAIRRDAYEGLGMREMTYGWNLEMMMRIAAARLPSLEIAVGHKRRAGGISKVSGNFVAGIAAAWTIAATFLRLALTLRRERST
jgi:glycosyltransferase involved in cell wall biosynthesis